MTEKYHTVEQICNGCRLEYPIGPGATAQVKEYLHKIRMPHTNAINYVLIKSTNRQTCDYYYRAFGSSFCGNKKVTKYMMEEHEKQWERDRDV